MDSIKIIYDDYTKIFSKGVIANDLLKTGLPSAETHKTVEQLKMDLIENKIYSITLNDLDKRIYTLLKQYQHDKYAENFLIFKKITELEQPIIILLVGTTGVGKSSIAIRLANRLNFRSVIGTDSIREIMRNVLNKDLVPELHQSSYNAGNTSKHYRSSRFNPVILGYVEQSKIVAVGVEGLIKRALYEGQNIIVEGVHLSPEFLSKEILDNPNIVSAMLNLTDEIEHKNRIIIRSHNVMMKRPAENYINKFENIRVIQDYLKEQTKIAGIKIVENIKREETINLLVKVVIKRIKMLIEDSIEI